MYLWYFWCCSVTAWKVPRWFHDSPGIMHPWLIWWVWCWCGNVVERLWRPEGVNISKGQVRAECMEWSHVAAENTGEHRRMLGMKFYVTSLAVCQMKEMMSLWFCTFLEHVSMIWPLYTRNADLQWVMMENVRSVMVWDAYWAWCRVESNKLNGKCKWPQNDSILHSQYVL